jgi:hypothetical protein
VSVDYGNVSTSIMREDPGIEARKIGLIDAAKGLGSIPIDTSKFAPSVAPLSEFEQLAMDRAKSGLGAYQPYLDQAGTALGGIGSLVSGLSGGAQMYDPSMAESFMNPYQRAVTDNILADMDREAAKARNQMQSRAAQAGAFRGSRAALMQSDFDRNIADIKSKRIAEDLSKRALDAGRIGIGGLGTLAGQYGQLGAMASGLNMDEVNMLGGLGALTRDIDQRTLDAEAAAARAAAYEPYSRLSYISDIFKGAPSTQTQLSLGMEPQTNPYAAGLGAMMGGYGAYRGLSNMFGGGNTPYG